MKTNSDSKSAPKTKSGATHERSASSSKKSTSHTSTSPGRKSDTKK